jgi:serralysin
LAEVRVASTSSVSYTGVLDVDGVLSGIRWADPRLTFSFASTGVSVGSVVGVNVQTLSTVQQDAIRTVLKMAASVSGLSFTEVADTRTSQGTLRFGESPTEITASGYYPSSHANGGDAWFNLTDYNSPRPGNYAFMTMLHETGHTLGLDHAHDGKYALPADHDSLEYSVMTYRSYPGGPTGAYSVRDGSYPRSFMLADIAALQYMYGANYGTNSGATTYRWNPTTGELSINGGGQGASVTNTILETIWDGGGTDTYDFGAYTSGVRVNINPGGWTTTSSAQLAVLGAGHLARGNIASAFLYAGNQASLIENVIGGSGADRITGNAAANRLDGGGGNDTLIGAANNDVLKGGGGADHFVFSSTLGPANIETIQDFKHDTDLIDLDDLPFRAIGTSLTAAEFYLKAGATSGHDQDDRIIYNPNSGKLFYDADGNKAGGVGSVHFATLTNKPAIVDHGDFTIV